MTTVTLILAQGPGLPDGDVHDRIVLRLCLNQQGQIDVNAYQSAPEPWLAERSRAGQATLGLEVVRLDEGWALQSVNSEDDPVWAFEGHVFRPGELVSLHGPDGEQLLYRIVATEA